MNSNKIKISRTGYLNGRKQGIEKIWHDNNKISEIRFYNQGKKVGLFMNFSGIMEIKKWSQILKMENIMVK